MLLRQLFEEKAKRIVAVMPGGFHPFHPGHKSLYNWAVKTFGQGNVYVAATLDSNKMDLKKLTVLSNLKTSFTNYIDSLEIETIDLKQKNIVQIQQKSIKETAWLQLLITMKFWLNDSSANFEKTEIFIEKSVNTSFDVIDSTPLKSIIDLGKFLYKEKMNAN